MRVCVCVRVCVCEYVYWVVCVRVCVCVWSIGIAPLIPYLDIFVKINPVAVYHIDNDIRAAVKHNNVFTRLIQFLMVEGSTYIHLNLDNRR